MAPSPVQSPSHLSCAAADFPRADGGAYFVVSFDGRVLLNVSQARQGWGGRGGQGARPASERPSFITASQAPGTLKDGGAGGYVGLVTGCHRAQFDNLLIQPLSL